jgi:AcrR family transcriptional regulator
MESQIADQIARPRGRPRRLDREAAAEIAMRLFWRDGYDGVSTGDLSAAMGVKPPSLYAAFGSKAGVFAAALDRYEALNARAFAKLADAATPCDAVRTLLSAAVTLYTAHDEERGCLVLAALDQVRDAEALACAAAHRSAFRDALVSRLTDLGDPAPERRADALVVAMQGLSAAARTGMQAEALTGVARTFQRGILAP